MYWGRVRYADVMINEVRFIDDMLQLMVTKTSCFKITPMKTHHIQWFNYMKELLTIVLYDCYPAV